MPRSERDPITATCSNADFVGIEQVIHDVASLDAACRDVASQAQPEAVTGPQWPQTQAHASTCMRHGTRTVVDHGWGGNRVDNSTD